MDDLTAADADDSGQDARWAQDSREEFARVAERASLALAAHLRAVSTCAGPGESDSLSATASELEAALSGLSEAEHTLTGAAAFWLEEPTGEAEVEVDHDQLPSSGPVSLVARLELTMDVTDAQALIQNAQELAGDPTIETVEDAVFAATHALGWDSLIADQVAGIEMQGASAELISGSSGSE